MARAVKRKPETRGGTAAEVVGGEHGGSSDAGGRRQGTADRRILRSRYIAVKNLISSKREDITGAKSERFNSIITEVESLHEHVQRPREQVADAEALLDIANTLLTSVRSQTSNGVTPSDFVTALLRNFGQQQGEANIENIPVFNWDGIGHAASHVFRTAPGCPTMIGPMYTELKQRKVVVQRNEQGLLKAVVLMRYQLIDAGSEVKADTEKNMSTIFEILRRKRNVRLENLVLNRGSFSETVENIFALSFLVKDGRAEITVDDSGHHLVSPRNAPKASAVASGEVSYSHFIFRFDFKDWKLMMDSVAAGEELMPHRTFAMDDVVG